MVTQFQENPRAIPAGDLAELVRAEIGEEITSKLEVCPTPREAWNTVRRSAEPGELVCIAGSFYLAAELRELVLASSNFATAPAPG
jgi:dihydrofolate synthase/folylpolyglutamate synthase